MNCWQILSTQWVFVEYWTTEEMWRFFPLINTCTRTVCVWSEVEGKRIIKIKCEYKHLLNTNINLPTTCKYPTWLIIGFVLTCIWNNKHFDEYECGCVLVAWGIRQINQIVCCIERASKSACWAILGVYRKPKTNKGERIRVNQNRPELERAYA